VFRVDFYFKHVCDNVHVRGEATPHFRKLREVKAFKNFRALLKCVILKPEKSSVMFLGKTFPPSNMPVSAD